MAIQESKSLKQKSVDFEKAEKVSEGSELPLSQCVASTKDRFSGEADVSAAMLAIDIMQKNSGYAGGKAIKIQIQETNQKRPFSDWLQDLRNLFDTDAIQQFKKDDKPAILHGRLIIVGLCLLDRELRDQLQAQGVFDALVEEINEPVKKILTKLGKELYFEPSDSVPNQTDDALRSLDEDMLGRAAFVRYLVRRMTTTDLNGRSYAIHLCGPWGSGKTTILNFLKCNLDEATEMSSDRKYRVIEFNAWCDQHITPPWWPLYDKIYRQSKKELPFLYMLKEFVWRLCAGQSFYLLIFILVLWSLVIILHVIDPNGSAKTWGDSAKDLSQIIALVMTVAGAAVGFSRSLLFGSAQAARSFQDYAHNPMQTIRTRFKSLIMKVNKSTIPVIFIDDLDRCQSKYVISLLEGIQTLFRQGDAFFIIAADRKWLHTCFEQEYKEFKDPVREPGKSLGALFTEKTFQLCTPVPGIHSDFKEAYWNQLINVQGPMLKNRIDEARASISNRLKDDISDVQAQKILSEYKDRPIYEQLAIREELTVHSASPASVALTEHTLKPFLPLLDSNPRAMKRLVNTYSVNRARANLSFNDVERDGLVQWTIITMRWPQLAEYLGKDPAKVEKIGSADLNDIDKEIRFLFEEQEVINVVEGGEIAGRLRKETVRTCTQLG